jgi:hypothetical protein
MTMRLKRNNNWTDEEIEDLRRMAAAELRVKTVAAALRRRPEAVRSQARLSGIRLKETRLLEAWLGMAQWPENRPRFSTHATATAADVSGVQ